MPKSKKERLSREIDELERRKAKEDIFSFLNFYDIKTEKDLSLNFRTHQPLVELYQDDSPYLVVKKSAQIGITTAFVLKTIFNCVRYDNLSIIYTLPTFTDVKVFSQTRYDKIVGLSRLKDSVRVGERKIEEIQNQMVKSIGNSLIYFRGTETEKQALQIPADIISIDELDRSKADIKEMYEKRLGASSFKWQWLFSTPTVEDFGIDREYKKSTQKEWLVRCRHCGKEQALTYFDNIRDGKFLCSGCHNEMSGQDRAGGRWVAKYPDRDVQGYHITKLIFPFVKATDLEKAEKDARFKRNFFNFDLGECYSEGENVIGRETILRQFRDFELPKIENALMGVDQGDILHYEISVREGDLRKIVRVGVCDSFDHIAKLMNRFSVGLCVIDALPNKHSAKRLATDFEGRVKMCYYSEDLRSDEAKETGLSITVDRTETLDDSADKWNNGLVIVKEIEDYLLREMFLSQMQNLKRTEDEDKHGQRKARWVRTGEDHFRHADNYNSIAFRLMEGKETGDSEVEFGVEGFAEKEEEKLAADLTLEEVQERWRPV